jgi:hypothetical protein
MVPIDEATVPRLYLDLEQPLERPGDLPFLIALRGRRKGPFGLPQVRAHRAVGGPGRSPRSPAKKTDAETN